MNTKLENVLIKILTVFIVAFIVAFTVALSWAVVAFFTWLITFCFGLQFTPLLATGVWLVILFAAGIWNFIFN